MSEEAREIKIVINLKGNRAAVGVQAAGCDPVFGTVEGNRDEIAQGALRILGEAEESWRTNPTYPKSTLPVPAPSPAATPRAAPARAAAKPASGPQPQMF